MRLDCTRFTYVLVLTAMMLHARVSFDYRLEIRDTHIPINENSKQYRPKKYEI